MIALCLYHLQQNLAVSQADIGFESRFNRQIDISGVRPKPNRRWSGNRFRMAGCSAFDRLRPRHQAVVKTTRPISRQLPQFITNAIAASDLACRSKVLAHRRRMHRAVISTALQPFQTWVLRYDNASSDGLMVVIF